MIASSEGGGSAGPAHSTMADLTDSSQERSSSLSELKSCTRKSSTQPRLSTVSSLPPCPSEINGSPSFSVHPFDCPERQHSPHSLHLSQRSFSQHIPKPLPPFPAQPVQCAAAYCSLVHICYVLAGLTSNTYIEDPHLQGIELAEGAGDMVGLVCSCVAVLFWAGQCAAATFRVSPTLLVLSGSVFSMAYPLLGGMCFHSSLTMLLPALLHFFLLMAVGQFAEGHPALVLYQPSMHLVLSAAAVVVSKAFSFGRIVVPAWVEMAQTVLVCVCICMWRRHVMAKASKVKRTSTRKRMASPKAAQPACVEDNVEVASSKIVRCLTPMISTNGTNGVPPFEPSVADDNDCDGRVRKRSLKVTDEVIDITSDEENDVSDFDTHGKKDSDQKDAVMTSSLSLAWAMGVNSDPGATMQTHPDALLPHPSSKSVFAVKTMQVDNQSLGASCADSLSSPNQSINSSITRSVSQAQSASSGGAPIPLMKSNSTSSPAKLRGRNGRNEAAQKMEWRKGALIGSGGYGVVHIGLNEASGQLMAVKIVPFDQKDPNIAAKVTMLSNEIAVMKQLVHANIVLYYSAERVGDMMHIFMEYIPGGSLRQVLDQFGPLGDAVASAYTEQVLIGVAYLHSQNVIHRDIKCANVLLTTEGLCKLADFGSSSIEKLGCRPSGETQKKTGVQGTPVWMAPEIITDAGHDWRCDIWSLGCTVMEMLTGKPPFAHYDVPPLRVLEMVVINPIQLPPGITRGSASFLNACLVKKPENRPAAQELAMHSWIRADDSPRVTCASAEFNDTMSVVTAATRLSSASQVSVATTRYTEAIKGNQQPLLRGISEKETEVLRQRRVQAAKVDLVHRASLLAGAPSVKASASKPEKKGNQNDESEDPTLKFVLGESDMVESDDSDEPVHDSPDFRKLLGTQ